MTKLLAGFLLLSFLTAGPTFAVLDDLDFEGSNVLRFDEGREVDVRRNQFEYPDNTINRRFVENRLRLDLYTKNLRLGGRFLYFRPSEADIDQYGLLDENRFDKRFLEATISPFEFRFGHYSDLWGQGLALGLFEDRNLYFDSELDGIRTKFEMGPLTLTGLRGTTADGLLVKKTDVTAGRIQLTPPSTQLGFNYVFHDSSSYPEQAVSSVDATFAHGIVSIYGEQAWNEAVLPASRHEGRASFLGVTLSKWNWSLLLEYNDYDYGVVTPLQNPPTTYREIGPRLLQGRAPHLLTVSNETGYQAELSGSATENTFVTLHYNVASRHEPGKNGLALPSLKQAERPFWEIFVNADHTFPGGYNLFLELGANEEAVAIWQKRNWVQARFKLPIRESQDLEFEIEGLKITDRIRNDEEFLDQLYSAGWSRTNFSIFLIYQMTDDGDLKKREGDNWPSIESAVTFGEGKHRMILFYGRERGGLKCSNGVCRQVQAFSGFRFTLETSL